MKPTQSIRSHLLSVIAIAALATTVGCGDDGGEVDVDASPDVDAAPQVMEVDLQFQALIGADPAACGQDFANIGTAGTTIRIADFRMFVSAIQLMDDGGNPVALTLEQDGIWQYEDTALLDFEDGTSDCSEVGTTETRTYVRGTVPMGTYNGVTFDLGVPFALNHQDTATAPSPFNLAAMQWNWQGGYKYLRADLRNEGIAPDNVWNIHLGATGCDSPSPADPPAEECAKPNRPTITLAAFDPASDVISLDLAALLANSDVSVNTLDTPPGCMSFPPDVDDCAQIFPDLGLSWDTGACDANCANQVLFSVAPGS